MASKLSILGSTAMVVFGLAACNGISGETTASENISEEHAAESPEAAGSEQQDQKEEMESAGNQSEKPVVETDEEGAAADPGNNSAAEKPAIDDEQKQMAVETLKNILKDAETGIVYGLSQKFKVGETTRDEVYEAIGEPEERLQDFDFYHGSMGNPSYQIAYDEQDTMKEARYFGTNVERQTNLGGITKEDLLEQAGKPVEERKIHATAEINIIYEIGDYEVQFIMAKDGNMDHVNLLEK